MIPHARASLPPLLAALAVACSPSGSGTDGGYTGRPPVEARLGDLELSLAHGSLSIRRAGRLVFVGATADVLYDAGSGRQEASLRTCEGDAVAVDGGLDLECAIGPLALTWRARLVEGKAGAPPQATFVLTARNASAGKVTVLRLSPLFVGTDGALYVGGHPRDHRVLENGRFAAFDQSAQLVPGDTPPFVLAHALPIPLRGNSVSNWTQALVDVTAPPGSPAPALVSGYLAFERTVPTIGVIYDQIVTSGRASLIGDGAGEGRTAFTTWAADCAMLFHGKPLGPGESVDSEPLWIDPLPADPLDSLERYADAVAAHLRVTPWPKRDGGRSVPGGWNSWSGSGGTGGYGTDIDDKLIAANLDVFRRNLQPFGDDYFQIDDGWQPRYGDWQWRADRFPEGGAAEAAKIAAVGLKPGLWIAALSAEPDSEIGKAHPDWLLGKEDGAIGGFSMDRRMLDASNPAVREHLGRVFKGIRDDGWKWVKGDFSYWAILGKPAGDPSMTNVEAFRAGWKTIRAALGPDVFLLGIGAIAATADLVDGMRMTLDNAPQWEEQAPDDVFASETSFKVTVRTGSRRWFYQNRLYVAHDDLILFRSWPGARGGPTTLEESRAFATWVSALGGSIEMGDRLVDMDDHPEWIDVARRVLPAWPDGARPLDVMIRDYPEQLRQRVRAPIGEWDVHTLIHWGRNRDWSTTPPTPLGETPRTYTIRCDGDCLVYEFWTGEYLGLKSGAFEITLDPRRARSYSLRRPEPRPQLLGTNRHPTQGATDWTDITWDAATRALAGHFKGAVGTVRAPFEHRLAFRAPPGYTATRVEVEGVPQPLLEQTGEVVRVRFTLPDASQGKPVAVRLSF